MNITDIFYGATGQIFSSLCVILLISLMFAMSLRLFQSRRRKAYLNLSVSLTIIIIQYLTLLLLEFSGQGLREWLGLMAQVLKVLSLLMINLAVFQLYNPPRRKHTVYFAGLAVVTILLMYIYIRVPHMFPGAPDQVRLLQNIGFELYIVALLIVFYRYIAIRVHQQIKYTASLVVYGVVEMAHIVNMYMLEVPLAALSFIEYFAPIVYYFILFLIVFERVVELLQFVYRSAITDGLTGLYNRAFFLKRVNAFIAGNRPISIIFSDIDNFKRLNDTEGHQAGDDALRAVAQIAADVVEGIGIAGRYGGEEIVLLLTDATVKGEVIAEALRSRVEEETQVTVSVGIAKYKKGLSADELLQQADEAMYEAKTTGKNKVVKYGGKTAKAWERT